MRAFAGHVRPARVLGGLLVLASSGVLAHVHLEQATPADGAILTSAPTELVLRFSEAARLTALSISRDGGAREQLTALPAQPQSKIVVALPALAPGHYVLAWRVLSADGHVMPGQVHFTLNR